jgi:hypothetical protein
MREKMDPIVAELVGGPADGMTLWIDGPRPELRARFTPATRSGPGRDAVYRTGFEVTRQGHLVYRFARLTG